MQLNGPRRRYLKAHWKHASDARLAKELRVDKATVRRARERLGLIRTAGEEKAYRENEGLSLPPYTGQIPVPKEIVRLRSLDYLAIGVVGIAALVVYLTTLGPTVTGEDSGELIAAAYTLGIPHPPGYPLWCLLAHVFTYIPLGSVAWRVALLSSVLGALTVALVGAISLKITHSRFAAVVGALAFAFSMEFWDQSVIAEVYTLNAVLIAGCLLALLHWYEKRRASYLYFLAVLYGLGLANHNTMHFLGPFYLAAVLFVDREPWIRWKSYLACVLLALFPLVLYAYLPLRSLQNPPVDWGNPETWAGFWDVVTRKQYSFGFTENPRTVGRFFHQVWAFIVLYGGEFTWFVAWVPILGALLLWRENRFVTALLAFMAAYIVLGFILLLNFQIDKESLWLNNVFWIPAYRNRPVKCIFPGGCVSGENTSNRELEVCHGDFGTGSGW